MIRNKIEPKYKPADFEAGQVCCPLCPWVPPDGFEFKDHISGAHRTILEGHEPDKKGEIVAVYYCPYRNQGCRFHAPRYQSGNTDTHLNRHFGLKPHRCPHTQGAQEDEPPENPTPPCPHADADPANLRKHRREAHGWRNGATAVAPPAGEPTFGVFNAQPPALLLPEGTLPIEATPGQPVRRARSTSRARYAPYTAPQAAAQAGPSRATPDAVILPLGTDALQPLDTTEHYSEVAALPFSGLTVADDPATASAFDGGAMQHVHAPFLELTGVEDPALASAVGLVMSVLQGSLQAPDVAAQAPVYVDVSAATTDEGPEETSYEWSSPSSASSEAYGQLTEPGWHPAISTLTYSGPEPLATSEPVPRNLVESGWSPDVVLRFDLLEAQSRTSA